MTLCDALRPNTSNQCIKKGPKRFSFRPFPVLQTSATAHCFRWEPSASAFPRRLGFVDRFLMIPAAAADGLVHRYRHVVVGGLGFAVAAAAESRAAPGRELIDLRGPVIQTCVHHNSPLSRNALLHGAPDSFSCRY